MTLAVQRQKQRVEDAETSFFERAVIKDVGRVPSDLGRLRSFLFVLRQQRPDRQMRERDLGRGGRSADCLQCLGAQLLQILRNLGGCKGTGGRWQGRLGQMGKPGIDMDVGLFSGSAGRRRGWFRHRPSSMHPVPMTLWRSRYPVRFQQLFEAYVVWADLRCQFPHGRRPGKPDQVIKRDTVMAPAVHSPWMPDRFGPGKRLAGL